MPRQRHSALAFMTGEPNFACRYVVAELSCRRLPDGTAALRHFGQWSKVVAEGSAARIKSVFNLKLWRSKF